MKGFIKDSKILIVSSQASQRAGIRKILVDLGATHSFITVASTHRQVTDHLATNPVNIFITEDEVENKEMCFQGLELHRQNTPASKDRTFILMTANATPFLMAEFSLRGGDVIINKPFTNEMLISLIKKTFEEKSKITTEEGLALEIQDAITSKDLDKANLLLKNFTHQSSFSYTYSLATILNAREDNEDAYQAFIKAMEQKTDFKSLVHILRLGVLLKKHQELAKYVDIWIKDFPLHHNSIPDIARVILFHQRYELLDEIFQLFSKYKITDTFATLPISAGFIIVAYKYLDESNHPKAIEYARRALEYHSEKKQIIFKAMEIHVLAGAKAEAEKIYLKTSSDQLSVEDRILDLMMKHLIFPKEKILSECHKLLNDKISHPDLYRITIDCLKDQGKNPENLIFQAQKDFPDLTF